MMFHQFPEKGFSLKFNLVFDSSGKIEGKEKHVMRKLHGLCCLVRKGKSNA